MSHRIFITGGASGLGHALGLRYSRAGWRVAIGDIHEARGAESARGFKEQGAPDACFLKCDVTREEDLLSAARWLEDNWGGVDVVVNNAGVAVGGRIEDVPISDWEWMLDINLLGVARGCKVFVPLLKRQGSGHLVNVASLAGLVHPPRMAPYNAAKAAVVALSETLYAELAPEGIAVSVVCPSFFRTRLAEGARVSDQETLRQARSLINEARAGAEEIAGRVERGIARRQFRILTDAEGRAGWGLKRSVPFGLYSRIMGQIMDRKLGQTSP